jgi:hypothetical protein
VAANDVKSGITAVEPPLVTPAPAPRQGRRPRAFETRFSLAYFGLAIIVSASIVTLGILLKGPNAGSGPEWSAWKPTAKGIDGARQIAKHVGARYRLPGGNQITANLVSPLSVDGVRLSQIAVRNGTETRDVNFYDTQQNAPYTLCGLGGGCSITEGKPSSERQRLIRREALELALYTFKYLSVNSVLAYLPPPSGQRVEDVVFLRKVDLGPALGRPLAVTLPSTAPFVSGRVTADAGVVDRLTADRIFKVSFQQIPDGTAIVVLSPRELAS